MIPKMIHYCWFGRVNKTALVEKCIDSWKKKCPDYHIIEWNEDNYDVSAAPIYVQQALKRKAWAFATDYIRYQVVYTYGGLYFDTDVELLKNLDPFLKNTAFFGFETTDQRSVVASGLGFGAEKGNAFLLELMSIYEKISFVRNGNIDYTPCPFRERETFVKHGLICNGEDQVLDNNTHIYPAKFFGPLDYRTHILAKTEDTVSIHWYDHSWNKNLQKAKKKKQRVRAIRNVLRFPVWIVKKMMKAERYEKIRIKILDYLS